MYQAKAYKNILKIRARSDIYESFMHWDGKYDYILNLSALKHVRSEKDPFTIMRMVDVNILYIDKTIRQAIHRKSKKYFCVSTDKATSPVNIMGASKKIMEMFLMRRSLNINVSTARFANVAFSNGSLLYSFNQRIHKRQPLVAPDDVKRYFITLQESGELCLLSTILGHNRDIFFPKLTSSIKLTTFAQIAVRYLHILGYEPYICENEQEAREMAVVLPDKGKWPCLFTSSDTTGEKDYEFKGILELHSDQGNGLEVIKNSLKELKQSKVSYLGNSRFLMKLKTKDPKKGKKLLEEEANKVISKIKSEKGYGEFKMD